MYCALIFAAAVTILPPFGLPRNHVPAAPTKVLSEKEMQEKIDTVNNQLYHAIDADRGKQWKQRKLIVTNAIIQKGIHPDKLGDYSWNPLLNAVSVNDIDFVRFLFKQGATLDCKRQFEPEPVFRFAKTVAMAQLLFDNGGDRMLTAPGQKYSTHGTFALFNATLSPEHETELIMWYADHGVDPNQTFTDKDSFICFSGAQSSLLLECVKKLSERQSLNSKKPRSFLLERISLLMRLGAPLTARLVHDKKDIHPLNVPQLVKDQLDYVHKQYPHEFQKSKQEASDKPSGAQIVSKFLSEARDRLIAASNYRHDGLKTDLFKVLPVAELCALTASYYVAQEPRYEVLEAMPTPSLESPAPPVIN